MAEKGVSDIKQFARVGTTLYKMVRQPSINGEFIERCECGMWKLSGRIMGMTNFPKSRSTMDFALFLTISTTNR